MKNLHFFKYQGTGNDFILLDNREGAVELTISEIAQLCHRRFGIGADGLMLLEKKEGFDFYMRYYNSDGAESSMCGNGGRCIAAFAKRLGIVTKSAKFLAIDGPHDALLLPDGRVSLSMQDVTEITVSGNGLILNTGSPHYVCWREEVASIPVLEEGRAIRNSDLFAAEGINVNFVARTETGLRMRTYERGVEDETFSCGTGAVAAAIAASGSETGDFETLIQTPGGLLSVRFHKAGSDKAKDVWLTGPAVAVFEGNIELLPA